MTNLVDLRRGITTRAAPVLRTLSSVRMVGTAATMGYCAVHLATTHSFSPTVFGGAVAFGAIVAVAATLLAGCLSSRPS